MSHNIIKTALLVSFGHLSGQFGFYTYFCWQNVQLKHILSTDLTFWIIVLIWNWNSDFKKTFSPHLNIHSMAKMVIPYLFMDILVAILKGALYLESPEFWKYVRCYCFLLCIAYRYDFKLKKSFSHHFNVQIMAKTVIFHLFQDILAAILKSALYLEFSRILKICYMLLLLTVYCIQIWFLTSKSIFSSF